MELFNGLRMNSAATSSDTHSWLQPARPVWASGACWRSGGPSPRAPSPTGRARCRYDLTPSYVLLVTFHLIQNFLQASENELVPTVICTYFPVVIGSGVKI